MRTIEEVEKAFSSEKLNAHQSHLVLLITNSFKELAQEIVQNVPASGDRDAAMRQLLTAKHTTMQAISHGLYEILAEQPKEVKHAKKDK